MVAGQRCYSNVTARSSPAVWVVAASTALPLRWCMQHDVLHPRQQQQQQP
jgi:hypothetical protein